MLNVSVGWSAEKEKSLQPSVRFGMITDPHYADVPFRGKRYYRESIAKMREAITFLNQQKLDFLIELGDFKDADKPPLKAKAITYLRTIEKEFQAFNGPTYHVLGNHDMDISTRLINGSTLFYTFDSLAQRSLPTYDYPGVSDPKIGWVRIDDYDNFNDNYPFSLPMDELETPKQIRIDFDAPGENERGTGER
jgi:predicted MPP superfamily phosphohydrolase